MILSVGKPAAGLLLALICALKPGLAQPQQISDPDFSPKVEHPAFTNKHPRVGIDESHRNFHTREGRYKPFADLMTVDGFAVSAAPHLEAGPLKSVDILVIANALGEFHDGVMSSAFTPEECDAVRKWVRAGGSLLLISDHTPFGDAARTLAQRFDIEVGRGYVSDPKNSDGNPTWLVFSAENGLLGDHAILRGRDQSERVRRVVAFTGQSLSVPANAATLLKLGDSATESFPAEIAKAAGVAPGEKQVSGRAQGIAMPVGKGRLVMFGEAALFSAQVATINGVSIKAGMNVPGNDDRQLALNVMHWLAHLID